MQPIGAPHRAQAQAHVTPGDNFDSSPLRRAIVGLVALKIAGLILVFDPGGEEVFHLVKSLFSRGLEWLLTGLILIALFRFGRAIVPRTRIHLFVGAFVAANILSALSAENAYIAMFGDRERYLGLTFILDMTILYVATAVAFRRTADWAVLAVTVALAGALSVGYAAMQALGLDPLHWDMGTGRPFGTFGNPDMLGQFLSLVFGGALGVAVFVAGRNSLLLRVAAASVASLTLVAAAVVATRGSLLGFAAALATITLLFVRLRGLSGATLGRIGIRMLLALTVLLGVVTLSPMADRARDTIQGVQVRNRVLFYESAIDALRDRPVLGYGPDNFAAAYPHYRRTDSTELLGLGPANSAHNWPLQTAATLGLVGLIAVIALVCASFWSLWTRGFARAPEVAIPFIVASVAYWSHGLVADNAISVDWWPWIAFGAAAALDAEPVVYAPAVRPLPRLIAVGVLAASVLGSLTGIAALRSNEDALVAKFAWEKGQVDVALGAAASAVREDPGRADHWNWLGLAFDLASRWREAGDAYAEAAARAPHDAAYWSNLARARTRQALIEDNSSGGAPAALEAARRAVATDPN